MFHSQSQVLHSHLDFASEQFACGLKPTVVFTLCILDFRRVAFVELLLVMESQFKYGVNIGNEVMRVLFLSMNFKDTISQVLNLFQEFGIHV